MNELIKCGRTTLRITFGVVLVHKSLYLPQDPVINAATAAATADPSAL